MRWVEFKQKRGEEEGDGSEEEGGSEGEGGGGTDKRTLTGGVNSVWRGRR